MHKTRVGILRGGPSAEYEVSLDSGASVLKALREHHEDKYQPHDIFIDREGIWHMEGVAVKPESVAHKVDVVFNALHGTYGEDGKVQHFFEKHQIPFTGSGSLGSALGMNKVMSKAIFMEQGIKTPYAKQVESEYARTETDEIAKDLFVTFPMPAVIKPAASGSSVGVTIVKVLGDIGPALIEAARYGDVILIEEYIAGVEATCGVLEDFRGHKLYALPPVEIRPHKGFYDYNAKYAHASDKIVPATFDDATKHQLEDLAKKVHNVLDLRHYSRTDFIVSPRRGIYTLEVNTLPGMTEESLMPIALVAVGSSLPEFIDHLIQLARRG